MKILYIGGGLIALIAVGGLLGAGYVFKQQQSVISNLSATRTALETRIMGLENAKLQSSKGEIEALAKSLKTTETNLTESTTRFRSEIGKLAEVEAKVNKTNADVTSLRQEIAKGQNDVKELRTASNIVSSSLKELEERYGSMSDRLATQLPLEDQGNYVLLQKKRFEAMPNERRVILSAFSALPLNKADIVVADAEVATTTASDTGVNTLDKLQKQFLARVKKGEDAHMLVGKALPIERLVWIESYNAETFDIVHPSLENNLWSKVDNRTNVPAVFKSAEFGLYYNKAGKLTVYQLTN